MARPVDLRMIFDSGQIVIYGARVTHRPDEVRDAAWDPYVQAWRAPACRYRHLQESMLGRSQAYLDGVGMLDSRIEIRPAEDTMRWERFAVDRWEEAALRGTIVYPARSNRVAVALAAIERVARPVLIVVTAPDALALWERRLRAIYRGPIDVLGANRQHSAQAPVVIALSEYVACLAQQRGNQFSMLIVDGVHRVIQEAGLRVGVESIAAPYRLGLTPNAPSPLLARTLRATDFGEVVFSAMSEESARETIKCRSSRTSELLAPA